MSAADFHLQLTRDAIERVTSYPSAIPNNPNPALRGPIAFGYVGKWLRCARTNLVLAEAAIEDANLKPLRVRRVARKTP